MGRRARHPIPETIQPEETGSTPCARGRACCERDYQDNPRLGPRAWCETDRLHIGSSILRLPRTYAELRLLLARTGQAEEKVSGSRDAPIPLAADVEAFMAHIVYVATRWEEYVRAEARLAEPPAGRRRDGPAVAAAARTLHAHLSTLLALGERPTWRPVTWARCEQITAEHGDQTWWRHVIWDLSDQPWERRPMDGTAAGLEFLSISGQARGMLGLSRQRRRISEVRCDLCKGKATLVQYEARDGGWEPRVRCTACPGTYAGAAYDLLMGRVYQAQLEQLEKHAQAS